MVATNKYGITIKYTIPSLTAAAFVVLPSPSKAARHMAHCAFIEIEKRKDASNKTIPLNEKPVFIFLVLFSLVDIVRCNHQIHNNTRHGNIQPNRKSDFRNFFVTIKTLCQSSDVTHQHQRNHCNRQ